MLRPFRSVLPKVHPTAFVDESAQVIGDVEIGEESSVWMNVVIRGDNVTAGYEANPDANAASFVNGWFRTGDQGRFDEDGYLWLTGRFKELINRGGEKISAEEVENQILAHPAVLNVAVVAMPDAVLGERACAFVIPRPGGALTLAELQRFLLDDRRIAKFKLPERLELRERFPMTPVGKISKKDLRDEVRRLAGDHR